MPYSHDQDTAPAELVDRRERRQLIRFDPTFSTGSIGLIVTWLISALMAYGTYTADKERTTATINQLRRDVDENRIAVGGSLTDIKGDVKEISRTLQDMTTSIAVLKARPDPMATAAQRALERSEREKQR